MRNPEEHIRGQKSVTVVHGEAFQLMLYREVDGPGEVWIWNSRDGVTPFGDAVEGKSYRHAMRGYPVRYTAVLPPEAVFVWISYTPETWEAMQRAKYEHFASRPDDEPYGGADFRKQFPAIEDWLAVSPFEHGQPRRVTREEFLATTPEWMGKPERETAEAA